MKSLNLVELSFNIIGVLGGLLTIYGFIESSTYKVFLIISGIVLIYLYLRWYITEYLTNKLKKIKLDFRLKINEVESNLHMIKEDLSFIRGWIDAINHNKNKKGAIDPILLIVIVIIVILIILYLQGKL